MDDRSLVQCLDALEGYVDNIKSTSDEGTEDNGSYHQRIKCIFIAKTEGAEETGNTETLKQKKQHLNPLRKKKQDRKKSN